jgi:transposase-like protein
MNKKSKIDYEELKKKTIEQLRSGKSLFGKDGAFAPLLKEILEASLEGEMEGHLDEEERAAGNRKNGKTSKKLKTADGTIDLETPRDRSATFEPQLVKKRETILAESLESKIIGMYSHGMSFRDISSHIKEMYDTDISAATLSAITDKVIPLVKEWQNRPLESLYCIVWLDAMYYKVKEDGRVINRCVYNILGASKDQKAFMADLKPVYQATSKDEAEQELASLEDKWGKKYPVVIDSWKRNWDKLSTYFQYSAAIRKLIYTTNTIEGFHRQVRKVTKTKGAFPSDVSLLKLIYLATQNIQKKWTQPLQNWGLTVSQLSIKFGDRLKLKI